MPQESSHAMGAYDLSPVRDTNGVPTIADVYDVMVEIRTMLRTLLAVAQHGPAVVEPVAASTPPLPAEPPAFTPEVAPATVTPEVPPYEPHSPAEPAEHQF